jgi:hypothetical protein
VFGERADLLHVLRADFFRDRQTRKDLYTLVGDAERLQAGDRRLPAHLHDLQFPDDGTPFDTLVQPEDAIGDGEDRVVFLFGVLIFADQKRRGLPTRQELREAMYERLHLDLSKLAVCFPR